MTKSDKALQITRVMLQDGKPSVAQIRDTLRRVVDFLSPEPGPVDTEALVLQLTVMLGASS